MKQSLGEPVDWSDPINRGLVLYYRMNEGMGDVVRDLSMNGNHGKLINMTHPGTEESGWGPGFRGAKIGFDGVGDYIDCGSGGSLDFSPNKPFSISAWIYMNDATKFRIINRGDVGDVDQWLFTTTGGDLFGLYIYDSILGQQAYAISTSITSYENQWIHVVGTYNGCGDHSGIEIYLNGVNVTSTRATDGTYNNMGAGGNTNIGSLKSDVIVDYASGAIDDVYIYNRTLSKSEIKRLYIEGNPTTSAVAQIPSYFVFDVVTTTPVETFTLPLEAAGTYNFEVHWGDGSWDLITAYNASEVTHTYANAGTHQIVIEGEINGWRFAGAGDCAKMRDIKSWGCLQLGNNNGYFYGCSGLDVSAADVINLNGITNLSYAFCNCSSLTTLHTSLWDMSKVTTLYATWFNCPSLASLDVSAWDTSSLMSLYGAFYNCLSLTDPVINNWDITSLTAANSFMFDAKALSTAVYDATLIAWDSQVEKPNVTISFGTSKYTAGGAAATARAALVASGWIITDGGTA